MTESTSDEKTITVEIAYALPDRQALIEISVPEGTTALAAVKTSGILDQFPDIDPGTAKMGIFSQMLGTKGLAAPEEYVLEERDRVEIYRPLIADPKEVRKQRAKERASAS
ncbi:MAG: RnfH family protein [bacterium]